MVSERVPLSAASYRHTLRNNTGRTEPVFDFRAIAVSVNRKELPHIIDRRCERMVNQGLIQEVYDLMHRGLLGADAVLRKAIGYGSSAEELEKGSGCLSQSDLVNILMRMGGSSRYKWGVVGLVLRLCLMLSAFVCVCVCTVVLS